MTKRTPPGETLPLVKSGAPEIESYLELLPCPVALWSPERAPLYLNPPARQMVGLDHQELSKDDSFWAVRIHPADRAVYAKAWEQVQGGERMVSCDYRFSANGSEQVVWIRETLFSHLNSRGSVGGVTSTYTDISDLKEQGEAAQNSREWGDVPAIIAGLVHEIQNNLQVLATGLDLLFLPNGTPEEFQPLVRVIRQVNKMIQELREYFLPPEEQPSRVDPGVILDDVVGALEASGKLAGIQLKLLRQVRLPAFEIDPGQFRKTLERVLEFSCALLPHGGTLEIATGLERVGSEPYIRLEVFIVSASSIEVEEKDVFWPFLRINGYQAGLGLMMAQELLHRYNGKILFQKQNPKEAHFTILLETR